MFTLSFGFIQLFVFLLSIIFFFKVKTTVALVGCSHWQSLMIHPVPYFLHEGTRQKVTEAQLVRMGMLVGN